METDRKESFTITLRKININHNVTKKDRRKKGKLCKHLVNASQTYFWLNGIKQKRIHCIHNWIN